MVLFSMKPFSLTVEQHPKLLSSNISHRRIALLFGVNRETVARKRSLLAHQADLSLKKYFSGLRFSFIQFDDLENLSEEGTTMWRKELMITDSRV